MRGKRELYTRIISSKNSITHTFYVLEQPQPLIKNDSILPKDITKKAKEGL